MRYLLHGFLTLYFILFYFYFYVSKHSRNLICSYLPLECYTDLLSPFHMCEHFHTFIGFIGYVLFVSPIIVSINFIGETLHVVSVSRSAGINILFVFRE
jgi:hypothetical protein